MSQSSPDPQHEEIAPPRAAPLTCCRKTGEPYTRHNVVEAEIARALGTAHTEWCGQTWRIETVVHLIRLRRRDNDPHVLGLLTHQFYERVKPIVDRWSRGFGPADSEEIQITVANRLGDLFYEGPQSRTAEYLEIDAATVIKQITLAAIGPDRPKARDFKSADRDEGGQYTPTVDRLAADGPDPAEQLLAKAEEEAGGALRYLHAVTDPRHREAFILGELYDWPLKDGPPGVPTLCERFNKSDRQIRNWINKAIEQMRAAHGAES